MLPLGKVRNFSTSFLPGWIHRGLIDSPYNWKAWRGRKQVNLHLWFGARGWGGEGGGEVGVAGEALRERSASISQPLHSSAHWSPRVLPKPLRVPSDLVLSHILIPWDFKGEELKRNYHSCACPLPDFSLQSYKMESPILQGNDLRN